jgi:hypothetical protein
MVKKKAGTIHGKEITKIKIDNLMSNRFKV